MTEERVKRKLSAILSADVKGYSRLMADDEEATVRTINAYREVMTNLIRDHRGRVVDAKGDNVLAEFSSVVDAVRCAVQVQKHLTERNSELPEHRRMDFRIGINLGDVIEEQGTIYGDGVNVAARLEGLAEGGGICISGTAFDHVKNRVSVGYEYQGKQSVKNIPDPVRVYKVLLEPEAAGKVIGEEEPRPRKKRWAAIAAVAVLAVVAGGLIWNFYLRPDVEPASVEKMAFPLPEKPSIAVLPFTNMSGDPEQEYFSDGLTEEIITALSKIPKLFVIARHSTFVYKGKPVKVSQVAEELGVRYVLEGSVRKSEGRVRITAQLIDALKGHHLWAERYDRVLKDIFAIQDEITMRITASLEVELTEGGTFRMRAKGTDNLEAYLLCLQASEEKNRLNKDGNILARQLAEKAIALDPNYPEPYYVLASSAWLEVPLGLSKDPKKSIAEAMAFLKKALALDNSFAPAYSILGMLYTLIGQHDKGILESEKATGLDPNSAGAYYSFGEVLRYAGRHDEAIAMCKKAIRLNPFPPSWYYFGLTNAYTLTGQYEEAIAAGKKAIEIDPNNLVSHVFLAAAYSLHGLEEEALAEAKEVLRISPEFSVDHWEKTIPYRKEEDRKLIIGALRKAGLPETPPLPLPDKPSIAVLPLVNMSGDPEQEYFSDGITEEIITALSKTPRLFVIARTSSFKYKGKEVDVRTVGRELGVKYVLEGSVRRAEDRVRITAQLVDAQTGHHLWAERYDRDLKDIFALQDDITMKITTSLHVKLTEGEQARIWGQRSKRLDVFLKVLEARWLVDQGTTESHERLGQVAQQIINMAPEIDQGYNWLAWYYWLRFVSQISPQESLMKAYQLARKSLSMDESNAASYRLLGNVYLAMKQYDKAIAAGKRSIALEPSSAAGHGMLGITLSYAGDPDQAIISLKQGIRLNPFPPYWYFVSLGRCYVRKGQYEEALVEYNKAQEVAPDNWLALGGKVVALSLLGREQEARAAVRKFSEINPYFSVDMFASVVPLRDSANIKKITDAMRKAGLK
jgi:adenylate cyclase